LTQTHQDRPMNAINHPDQNRCRHLVDVESAQLPSTESGTLSPACRGWSR
jgi:hypothetical protein